MHLRRLELNDRFINEYHCCGFRSRTRRGIIDHRQAVHGDSHPPTIRAAVVALQDAGAVATCHFCTLPRAAGRATLAARPVPPDTRDHTQGRARWVRGDQRGIGLLRHVPLEPPHDPLAPYSNLANALLERARRDAIGWWQLCAVADREMLQRDAWRFFHETATDDDTMLAFWCGLARVNAVEYQRHMAATITALQEETIAHAQ